MAWILAIPMGGFAAPSCGQRPADFDCSPLKLPESLAQQPVTVQNTGAPAAANPDSESVLDEEAREGNPEALAKQAQNPVASLISVPIQWNSVPGTQWAPRALDPRAQANRTFNVWNVQPVVPFPLNDSLTLVSRTIVPITHRPLAGETDVIGIGDINPTVFLVPRTGGI